MSSSYEKRKVMHHFMNGNHEVIDSRTGIRHCLEGIIEYVGDWYPIGGIVKGMSGSSILSIYYDSEDDMLHLSHMPASGRTYTFANVFRHDTIRIYNNPVLPDTARNFFPEDQIKQIIFKCGTVLTENGWVTPGAPDNPVRQYLSLRLIITKFLSGEEVYDDSTGEMCNLSTLVEFNHDKFIAGWTNGTPGFLHMVYYDSEDDMLHLEKYNIGCRINSPTINLHEVMLYNMESQTHGSRINRIIDRTGCVLQT